jgi:hypothetical protein
MSKNRQRGKTRQQKLKEKFLNNYPEFPIDKINNVLLIGSDLRNLKLGVVDVEYNEKTDNIIFKLHSNLKKKDILVRVVKLVDYETVMFTIYLNNKIYKEEKCVDKKVVMRIKDILSTILLNQIYNNEEIFNILEKISLANSLAKTNPENKSFLYAVKHAFLNYILFSHPSLVEYEKPTTMTGEEKLLEVKIGNHIFHLPYDKKSRYGFFWTEETQPEVYIKETNRKIPEDLDINKLNIDLFNVYLSLFEGKLRNMKSDGVRYWYTREIMKKIYVNPDINLVRVENNNGEISNYSAQNGAIYDLIDTKTGKKIGKSNTFWNYFNMAVRSGLKIE